MTGQPGAAAEPDRQAGFLEITVDAATRQWVAAIRASEYLSADDDEIAAILTEILDLMIAVARADSTNTTAAKLIGTRLAQPPFDQIRVVAPTVATFVAVAPREADTAARWADVVGHVVDGYAESLRERSLHQQEQILAAAISVRTSEVITLQEQLRHQATHDALTGLVNRAHLQDSVDSLLTAPLGLGLLIIDLDGFKFINDGYGHAVGDEVLVVIGRRLRAYARSDDIVGRYGGDEFIIATRATEADVRGLVARMVIDLREPFITSAGPIAVDASIGYAYHDRTAADDFTSLLRTADHAMYGIKAGRRRPRRTADE